MRLTLRTLLAYLDDILEPNDRDEIGRKIEESQFASQLVQRLRDCTRNLRLGAPRLSGRSGLDSNTVAGYLDNTLAGEQVPDFEKVCLESDIHLAEVTSCHQILTMVLGQPAQIEPEMKRRMYALADQSQVPSSAPLRLAPAEDAPVTMEEIEIRPVRHKPEVPDYLRQGEARSGWKSIAAGIILLVVFAVVITLALGPLDHTNPVAGWLFSAPQAGGNQVAQNGAPPDIAAPAQPQNADRAVAQPKVGDAGGPAAPGTDKAAGSSSPPVIDNPPAKGAPAEATADLPQPSPIVGSTPPTNDAGTPVASADNASRVPPLPQPPGEMPTPLDPRDRGAMSGAAAVPLPGDTNVRQPLPTIESPQLQPVPASADIAVGRFLPGKGDLLLALDPVANQWTRVAAGAALSSGDQLLVLPTFRPTIALSEGLTLQVPPETRLELEPPDAHGVPGIKLLFGRLVAMTTGKAGARLRLNLGPASGTVTFADADATLGIEVRRYFPIGSDPESQEPRIAADIYAASGQIEWASANGATVSLMAPQRWGVSTHPDDMPAAPTGPPSTPKWIVAELLNANDARASEALATALAGDKPLLWALREMVAHRRVEYRSFAAQCLALVDDFEPLAAAFHDVDQRSMWPMEIATARMALARGPGTAAKVREAFEKRHGEDVGKQIYRIFWGYTKGQLQAGEAARLVEYLDFDLLDFRVLAFANLQEITNKSFSYRPDATAAVRSQPIKRWQELLRTGGIVPREPPPPR